VRALGVDLGAKRIGVAVSDAGGLLASPIEVITRSSSRREDHRRIKSLAVEWEAECLVIGLPLSMDGTVGPAATSAMAEAAEIEEATGLRVELVDERLSTVEATRGLQQAGVRAREGREVVDKIAAAVILQAWLDRNRRVPEGEQHD